MFGRRKRQLFLIPLPRSIVLFKESLDEYDFEVFKSFFKDKFEAVNKVPEKGIYVHYTTSTDTELMKTVINVIM